VEKYPVAAFTATGVESNGANHVLNGQFTLKGVTKPVSLDLEFNGVNPGMGQGEVAGFEASIVLNRKDFGIEIDLPLEPGVLWSATRSPSRSTSRPSSRRETTKS
jgi:polyisoprenoid-binding protein YceI